MEMTGIINLLPRNFKKYRPIIIALLVGILLMLIPGRESPAADPVSSDGQRTSATKALQDSLAAMLCHLQGAGKVQVLLTEARGEQIVYQADEEQCEGERRKSTVLVHGDSREEVGLIRQVNSPVYQGAVVLCQGGDRASVRLGVVEAVTSVTGLGSDRVIVLKME